MMWPHYAPSKRNGGRWTFRLWLRPSPVQVAEPYHSHRLDRPAIDARCALSVRIAGLEV